jgi:hypothetical protein
MPNIDDIKSLIFNVDAATTLVKKKSERINFLVKIQTELFLMPLGGISQTVCSQ